MPSAAWLWMGLEWRHGHCKR
ncbi:Protein of unknown function [Pyronema omphalodes CBS 100304]|uniref:Uncharacterized protein n=1 Tax=Pyronema omphalodes (strain CBS 100304) TaxID=1076935 RepID=U4LUK3_PYROM|nr:Protein of unknown function [Pyronema omphalodes CBS 100304]